LEQTQQEVNILKEREVQILDDWRAEQQITRNLEVELKKKDEMVTKF
jgi:hypothetical protein